MSKNLSICVYCGSRNGEKPAYLQGADALGTAIGAAGHRLVYGAGDVGLMGRLADACLAAKGEVFGVIPHHLVKREVGKTDLTHLVVTETMHERKKVMAMNSDVFVILPGGFGTLDEFFEVLTWRQLGLHDKPIFVLNIDGFWDPLLDLMSAQIDQGFASQENLQYFTAVDSVEALMAAVR